MNFLHKRFLLPLGLVPVFLFPMGSSAQLISPTAKSEPASLAAYLSPTKYSRLSLSPNGQHLAMLTPVAGKLNLAVIDLKAGKSRAITSLTEFDVVIFHWIGNERLAFSVGRVGAPTGWEQGDGGGLFVVNRDGTGLQTITPTRRERLNSGLGAARGLSFKHAVPGSDREFIAYGNLRVVDSQDVYRVDAATGKQTLLTFQHPGRVSEWVLDHQDVPRLAVLVDKDDGKIYAARHRIMYRASAESPWVQIETSDPKGEQFVPISFEDDNRTLIVASNRGRDTTALYRFDPETKRFIEKLAEHPRYDMGVDAMGSHVPGVIQHPASGKILGYEVSAETGQISWVDPEYARVQTTLETSFKAKDIRIQRREGARTLVAVSASNHVPRYYLFDEKANRLEELFAATDKLQDQDLSPVTPFLLKTRDGLEIPSYYVLPQGYKTGQVVPTVVHIHGGPHARADNGGYMAGFGMREAQVLASRGYAVVLPNFRITPGFGRKIYEAGFGEVGRKISEDHEDAYHFAVKQGFADPRRVCITGASYGGYATLQALAKTPDLFACGIAGLLVSDYEVQLTSTAGDSAGSKAGVDYWRRLLGQTEPGWEIAQAYSPARYAHRLKAPLGIYAGRDDVRTPMEQTELMIDALKRTGRPPEWVFVAPQEGHGFGKLENNVKTYELMLDFLDRHIGAKSRLVDSTPISGSVN